MTEIEGERRRAVGPGSSSGRWTIIVALLLILSILLPLSGPAPVFSGPRPASAQAAPGWMTPDQAALFTNDWPSLVPSWVPEPFASVAPSISISGAEYRLYWYVGGGAPTFLDVHGFLGSNIPDGSFYDLNNQLFVNATVRGSDAYHDPTPIYDAVYWEEAGASYWVTAQGMAGDVVSFANGFTVASAPAVEPTATVAPPVRLLSPDAIASGGVGTVTASGGGTGATLVADGGVFSDTGTATYPGAGDAAVAWVAPNVTDDTTVTFSLLDAGGAVLVSTPTLVTAAEQPVAAALDCPPSVSAGQPVSVAVTGSGNIMLDAGAGSWPQTSPNTDYDPGTDGATLAFTLGGGGSATLTWAAPGTAQTTTVSVFGPSGMVVASCRVDVVSAEPTLAPTVPEPTTETIPPTVPVSTATAAGQEPAPAATSTASGTSPGDGISPGDGLEPGNGSDPVPAPSGTVPGTNPGDGVDPGSGPDAPAPSVTPVTTAVSGDGTDLGGVATLPPRPTWPAIPTSAPLPDAPPTSSPPAGPSGDGAGSAATATATPSPAVTRIAPVTPPATATAVTGGAVPIPARPTATPSPMTPPTATATRAVPTATRTVPAASAAPAKATATAAATATVPLPTATLPIATATSSAAALRATSSPRAASTATPAPPTATATVTTATPPPPTATSSPTLTPTSLPVTATPIPPTPAATATPRPPATATSTPVRPGQAAPATVSLTSSPTPSLAAAPSLGTPPSPATPTASAVTPTPTAPPETDTVTGEIGPAGGTLRHPGGARLDVAEGVFEASMSVSMTQLPDSALPVATDVDLIPATGYDVRITAEDGTTMTTLPAGVVLGLDVPAAQRDQAVVYWIDGDALTQLGVTNRETGGISAPLAHLSRYVAGVPITENPDLGWLPWIVALAAALSGLVVVVLLSRQARRQRRPAGTARRDR